MKIYSKKRKKKKKKEAVLLALGPFLNFLGVPRAMGRLPSGADWEQLCVARVSSAEVKGGGVRNAAEAGRVRCRPRSCGVSTAQHVGVRGGL